MRRWLLAISMTLLAASAFAHDRDHHRSMSIESDGDSDSCDDRMVRFGNRRAAMSEEEVTVGSLRALKIRGDHAGIRVAGSTAGTFRVKVCKAAALPSDLASIRVSLSGNELSANGPDDNDWVVFYIVDMPRGGDLGIDSQNGPVSLRDVDGTVLARAQNGPLSLQNSSGNIDAETVNGPISVTGGSGNVKLQTNNGPLSVKLSE